MDPIKLLDYGIAVFVLGIILFRLEKRLDKIAEALSGLVQQYTILITSLPEVKKRAREEAKEINERINGE